ncbi:hypothetical protein RJ641_008862, partial [Dillenia turbinata]
MIRYPSSSISNSSFIASIKFVKNWEITLERGKKVTKGMDDDINNSQRRMSRRNHKVAALASADNRTQAALARLEALENDNTGVDAIEIHDDDDDDDVDLAYMQKRQSKCTKRKTRQAKALENARKTPRTFLELLHEQCDLHVLPLVTISAQF